MDYYKILGVSKDASQDDIDRAYRAQAIKLHPDRNPNNPEATEDFKKCAEAYEVLGDADKRKQYDRGGSRIQMRGSPFFDIFDSIFGGSRRPQPVHLHAEVQITLEEAKAGCAKVVKVNRSAACKKCNGSGASVTKSCSVCQGSGVVEIAESPFVIRSQCNGCHGTGVYVMEACPDCRGRGFIKSKPKEIAIKIPAGISAASRLRIAGEGEPGQHGAPTGDLYVTVIQQPHNTFLRDGDNLICEVELPYTTLVFGGQIDVPTVEGKAELKVSKGTPIGTRMRLKHMGMPNVRTTQLGDLIVVLNVKIPTTLTKEMKKALQRVAELERGQ